MDERAFLLFLPSSAWHNHFNKSQAAERLLSFPTIWTRILNMCFSPPSYWQMPESARGSWTGSQPGNTEQSALHWPVRRRPWKNGMTSAAIRERRISIGFLFRLIRGILSLKPTTKASGKSSGKWNSISKPSRSREAGSSRHEHQILSRLGRLYLFGVYRHQETSFVYHRQERFPVVCYGWVWHSNILAISKLFFIIS